ncbi:MAG TPA: hypothetical protein VM935_16465 [Chitinophagaceae bacterium]|jgi:hypothetical protein|nr:hypothetical protein [Chitinophagaceae bacterium]
MIRILIAFSLLLSLSGCKKVKEKILENQAMQFITIGQWKVVRFTEGPNDLSGDFLPYTFQFRTNYSVDAIKNGTKDISGTWSGNEVNSVVTIHSSFPQAASNPLPFLNGIFRITNPGFDFVEAAKTVNGVVSTLRMERI